MAKVVAQGSGSALLKDLLKMRKIIETIKNHSNKRYTSAKTRLGFDTKIPEDIAKAVEDAGADWISIHGRTRIGQYKSKVDYEAISRANKSVNIPVIANGDITSFEIAKRVKETTGCSSLMIGRGAIGNPWIFYQIKNSLDNISKEKIKEIVLEHFENMIKFYGNRGVILFRKHLHTYSKGLPNASLFRDKINRVDDTKEAREIIEEFLHYKMKKL